MRALFGLVLIAGLGLAGFAVYMAKGQFGRQSQENAQLRAALAQMVETTEVFIVNRQITYGERLTAEDIVATKWPVEAVPEGSFTSLEELFPEGGPKYRTVTRTMEESEAVLALKVTEPGMQAGIQSRLKPGMRAFAIRVDVTSGVSGFLRPGDHVDVYWSGRRLDQNVTRLIDTSVEIVAIDQSANDDLSGANIARTITVQVSPQEVASLAQAQASGRLTLSLVGVDDETVAEAIEVNQDQLLGIEREQVIEREVERVCTTRERRGGQIVETPIPCAD